MKRGLRVLAANLIRGRNLVRACRTVHRDTYVETLSSGYQRSRWLCIIPRHVPARR